MNPEAKSNNLSKIDSARPTGYQYFKILSGEIKWQKVDITPN